jgi:hypothetical protein
MGWKSTIDITRREAINAIISCIDRTPFDEMSNEELENMMYGLGIGDDLGKPYFGHNFSIINEEEDAK